MSLLLEALKKAEKAKEEAQRRAGGESRSPAGESRHVTELRLQEDPAPPADEKPRVHTRAELPEISQSLEIHSDDLAPKAAGEPRRSMGSAAPSRARAAPRAQPGARPAGEPAAERVAERNAARKVFEAKFREPNPRLPFYAAMGVLGVAAFCTIGYFWYQLRPAPTLVNTNPPPAGAQPAAVAAAPAAPASAPVAGPAAQPSIPGLPSASVVPATPSAPLQSPLALAAAPQSALRPQPRPLVRGSSAAEASRRTSEPRPLPAQEVEPVSPRAPAQVHPKVESAYSAYLAGDLGAARADYEQALREDPANRDALLGVAAVDVRGGRLEAAEATYLRLLRADPRDAHAQAGLIALRGGRMDPLVAESRLKTMLATDPGAHALYFTLGNQLAQQGRWAEAQQQYFKAYAADPENPDFAYNLAVSLDHLRQSKLALEYYQRALALAAKRGASFDPRAARERIVQLGS